MSAFTIATEGYGYTVHLMVLMGYGDAGPGGITSTRLTKDIDVTIHREEPRRWDFKVVGRRG